MFIIFVYMPSSYIEAHSALQNLYCMQFTLYIQPAEATNLLQLFCSLLQPIPHAQPLNRFSSLPFSIKKIKLPLVKCLFTNGQSYTVSIIVFNLICTGCCFSKYFIPKIEVILLSIPIQLQFQANHRHPPPSPNNINSFYCMYKYR